MATPGARTVRAVQLTLVAMAGLAFMTACNFSAELTCPSTPGNYRGELPAPVEQMSAADFARVVGQKVWKGTRVVDRDCAESDCQTGGNGGPSARIKVQAIEDSHCVDHVNLGDKDVVVGRMINVGPRRDVLYRDLPQTDEANPNVVWYIVWARRGGTAVTRLVRLTVRGPGSPAKEMDDRIQPVKVCDTHTVNRPDAGFKKCPARTDSTQSASSPFAPPVDRSATAWLSCAQGCCTADYSR